MKHFPYGILITILFIFMLFMPKAVFNGAAEGLLLWYQIVFPTLFPFMLVTGLLMASGGLHLISRIFSGLFCRIFRVSENGTFAVLTGFLCGYPMGAKVTADLMSSGRISYEEGCYLLSFCNNTSPIFILNFIVWKTFGREDLAIPTLSILILAPVLLSFLFRRLYLKGNYCFQSPDAEKKLTARLDFSTLDTCMMNSFESLIKVGGYIILFSVLITLLDELPGSHPLILAVSPLLEVTNGIMMLDSTLGDFFLCYPAVLALTSFGGFCSVAQTQCMLQGTGLKILPYTAEKLAAAAAASLMAVIYLLITR